MTVEKEIAELLAEIERVKASLKPLYARLRGLRFEENEAKRQANPKSLDKVQRRADDRRKQAVSLREKGKTFREIGTTLGITPQHARNIYLRSTMFSRLREQQKR